MGRMGKRHTAEENARFEEILAAMRKAWEMDGEVGVDLGNGYGCDSIEEAFGGTEVTFGVRQFGEQPKVGFFERTPPRVLLSWQKKPRTRKVAGR